MSSAIYTPDVRSVADVRRLEISQLLSAFEALHVEGIIDGHEYHTKCRTLTDRDRFDD
jgi:hypothetical protein